MGSPQGSELSLRFSIVYVLSVAGLGLIESEVEIETGLVLKLQAPLPSIRLAPDDGVWSHEAENLKLFRKLCRIPDLAILGFEALPLGRWVVRFHRAVDRRQSAAADFFGFVICGHNCRLWQIGRAHV